MLRFIAVNSYVKYLFINIAEYNSATWIYMLFSHQYVIISVDFNFIKLQINLLGLFLHYCLYGHMPYLGLKAKLVLSVFNF